MVWRRWREILCWLYSTLLKSKVTFQLEVYHCDIAHTNTSQILIYLHYEIRRRDDIINWSLINHLLCHTGPAVTIVDERNVSVTDVVFKVRLRLFWMLLLQIYSLKCESLQFLRRAVACFGWRVLSVRQNEKTLYCTGSLARPYSITTRNGAEWGDTLWLRYFLFCHENEKTPLMCL